jgi:hypothetical protein
LELNLLQIEFNLKKHRFGLFLKHMLVEYVSCELWDIKARGGPTARMQSKALPSPGKAEMRRGISIS